MPFRVSGLGQADVQSALNNQGYTATRAANLDAAISSRAAAADYTAARAAKLDQLDAAISSRAAPGAAMALASPYDTRLDAAISSRAAPGAAMDLVAGAKAAIWDEAMPETPAVGSFGERVKNNLNATIDSRADAAEYSAARAAKLDQLDAAITSRASPTDVDTNLGDRGITIGRMAKLDAVLSRTTNSGNVAAGSNSAGLTVSLDTGGAADQARSVVEVMYSCGDGAAFFAEGSDDNTTWYEGDTFSEVGAATNKLVGYLNTHRYFRFRSPTTGIDLSFEVRALL